MFTNELLFLDRRNPLFDLVPGKACLLARLYESTGRAIAGVRVSVAKC